MQLCNVRCACSVKLSCHVVKLSKAAAKMKRFTKRLLVPVMIHVLLIVLADLDLKEEQ